MITEYLLTLGWTPLLLIVKNYLLELEKTVKHKMHALILAVKNYKSKLKWDSSFTTNEYRQDETDW